MTPLRQPARRLIPPPRQEPRRERHYPEPGRIYRTDEFGTPLGDNRLTRWRRERRNRRLIRAAAIVLAAVLLVMAGVSIGARRAAPGPRIDPQLQYPQRVKPTPKRATAISQQSSRRTDQCRP